MKERIELQRQSLVTTLQRMKRQISTQQKDDTPTIYQIEYEKELEKYRSMLAGGDGGKFRNSDSSVRDLHFAGWKDSDFQILLEAIGEAPVLSDEEWDERFASERGFISKLFGKGGRPK